MDIVLKIVPFPSDYSLEQRYLRIPVLYSYEDRDGYFVHTITDGLPIIGKPHPETREMSYYIGDVCTLEQLTDFINNLSKNLSANIVFCETEDSINSIEYDAINETWTHKTGTKIGHFGSVLKIKMTRESLRRIIIVLENYRKLAFMTIEGHRILSENVAFN